MKHRFTRRNILATLGGAVAGAFSLVAARTAKGAVKHLVRTGAPKDYDPTQHKWLMCFDINQCIGCGLCVDACKTENHVPQAPTFFRTWIERYIIKKPQPGAGEARGETIVDSPNGGRDGFPPTRIPREEILKSFFVPKLCNLCEHSPCVQACPVGATFDSPDGAVLVDPNYCIGCGFCIQACPYGCRYFNHETHTADKCTLCYHRITRGLNPACVEICPTDARVFGDLKNAEDPIHDFIAKNIVNSLKPHLGTGPRVLYAGMDKEVH
jgi:Fe-S-cluster-containing dehydrogenase component